MDMFDNLNLLGSPRCMWVNGPIIVGGGPSGLAVASCLKERGVPYVILERADCMASLWQKRTYDRLKLHLPKKFCQLPGLPFPESYPEYPCKKQFIIYLESYAAHFGIFPIFNQSVQSARYDKSNRLWRVRTMTMTGGGDQQVEYMGRWLVVATGENAERVIPDIQGLEEEFGGEITHVCDYKSGRPYQGKKVLVVGCGNSGMEVGLDLCNNGAFPSLVVRESVHVLPREVYGNSTFELAIFLMKWLPLWLVDKILLILAWLVLGNIKRYGLKRPSVGPLQLKNTEGRTPVLDIGAISKIKSGEIEVVPGVKRFIAGRAEFIDGQGTDFFTRDGMPKADFPNSWKGKCGLYVVGFTRRGLAGVSADAVNVAGDLGNAWKKEMMQAKKKLAGRHRRCISQIY